MSLQWPGSFSAFSFQPAHTWILRKFRIFESHPRFDLKKLMYQRLQLIQSKYSQIFKRKRTYIFPCTHVGLHKTVQFNFLPHILPWLLLLLSGVKSSYPHLHWHVYCPSTLLHWAFSWQVLRVLFAHSSISKLQFTKLARTTK